MDEAAEEPDLLADPLEDANRRRLLQALRADPELGAFTREAIKQITEGAAEVAASGREPHPPAPPQPPLLDRAGYFANKRDRVLLRSHWRAVTAVCAFRHEGRLRVVTGSDDEAAHVWDPAKPSCPLAVLDQHTGWLRAMAVYAHPDTGEPRLVTGAYDRMMNVWDPIKGGEPLMTIEGLGQIVTGVATFVHAGRPYLLGALGSPPPETKHHGPAPAADGLAFSVRVWDPVAACQNYARDGKPLRALAGHSDFIYGLATFAEDGAPRVATASHDKTVRVYDPVPARDADPAAPVAALRSLAGHQTGVNCVAAFDDAGAPRLVSGDFAGAVALWDPVAGTCLRLLGGAADDPLGIVFAVASFRDPSTGAARVAAGSADGCVRVWDPAGAVLQRVPLPKAIRGLATDERGLAVAYTDGGAFLDLVGGLVPPPAPRVVPDARKKAKSDDVPFDNGGYVIMDMEVGD